MCKTYNLPSRYKDVTTTLTHVDGNKYKVTSTGAYNRVVYEGEFLKSPIQAIDFEGGPMIYRGSATTIEELGKVKEILPTKGGYTIEFE